MAALPTASRPPGTLDARARAPHAAHTRAQHRNAHPSQHALSWNYVLPCPPDLPLPRPRRLALAASGSLAALPSLSPAWGTRRARARAARSSRPPRAPHRTPFPTHASPNRGAAARITHAVVSTGFVAQLQAGARQRVHDLEALFDDWHRCRAAEQPDRAQRARGTQQHPDTLPAQVRTFAAMHLHVPFCPRRHVCGTTWPAVPCVQRGRRCTQPRAPPTCAPLTRPPFAFPARLPTFHTHPIRLRGKQSPRALIAVALPRALRATRRDADAARKARPCHMIPMQCIAGNLGIRVNYTSLQCKLCKQCATMMGQWTPLPQVNPAFTCNL